jgi:two-component system, LytTR family, response regulator
VTLRVLIVDDERIAREGVRQLLGEEADVEVVGECGDGGSAVKAIETARPDVVLLDIQMPVMDGFAVIRAIPEDELPVVVFLTAYDQHAIKAFDAQALDYVVKPFSDARFRKAIARARTQVRQRRLGSASSKLLSAIAELEPAGRARRLTRIPVRSVSKTTYVRVEDIQWIGAADYYAELHTADGRTHLVRETMQNLEGRLDPSQFMRVHRSAIVNLDAVVEVRTDEGDRHVAVLRGGAKVPLGRGRREALDAELARR